ncbi:putative 1,3-beta-glucanosyltransferase, partial [Rhizodiscina lignyota]
GSHFFYKTNGSEFFIRGVAYQDNGHFASESTQIIDPFGDGPTCQRDIAYFQKLGLNTVRAYAVDASQDHSECMQYLADAGIYVITDLGGNNPISQQDPQWNYPLYDQFTSVVDAFQNYTNILGFFVGNEIVNTTGTSNAAAAIKAATRDIKAYIKKKNYRTIPVGYSSGDDADVRMLIADYLNCGDQDDSIDMLGMNLYSWCGDSSLTESGYDQRIDDFQNYSIPLFLSEYGCNTPSPRNFTEVSAIYGNEMTKVFSGGIVYQYYQDEADFGLVSIEGDSVSTSADFSNLSKQLAKATPSSTAISAYSPSNSPQSCPATGTSWSASPTLPPIPYARLCTCMMQSLTCVVPSNQSTDPSIGQSLSYICQTSADLCLGAETSPLKGQYGAYTVCNSSELVSWAYNQYYLSQSSSETACSKVGGVIQSPVKNLASDCSDLLHQAGAAGTGTITSTPT